MAEIDNCPELVGVTVTVHEALGLPVAPLKLHRLPVLNITVFAGVRADPAGPVSVTVAVHDVA